MDPRDALHHAHRAVEADGRCDKMAKAGQIELVIGKEASFDVSVSYTVVKKLQYLKNERRQSQVLSA